MALIDAKNFKEVIEFAKIIKKLIVITRGEDWCSSYYTK